MDREGTVYPDVDLDDIESATCEVSSDFISSCDSSVGDSGTYLMTFFLEPRARTVGDDFVSYSVPMCGSTGRFEVQRRNGEDVYTLKQGSNEIDLTDMCSIKFNLKNTDSLQTMKTISEGVLRAVNVNRETGGSSGGPSRNAPNGSAGSTNSDTPTGDTGTSSSSGASEGGSDSGSPSEEQTGSSSHADSGTSPNGDTGTPPQHGDTGTPSPHGDTGTPPHMNSGTSTTGGSTSTVRPTTVYFNPTNTPSTKTNTPLSNPTNSPTSNPTNAPTSNPTIPPTSNPTNPNKPTISPISSSPTEYPTIHPTEIPTPNPTDSTTIPPINPTTPTNGGGSHSPSGSSSHPPASGGSPGSSTHTSTRHPTEGGSTSPGHSSNPSTGSGSSGGDTSVSDHTKSVVVTDGDLTIKMLLPNHFCEEDRSRETRFDGVGGLKTCGRTVKESTACSDIFYFSFISGLCHCVPQGGNCNLEEADGEDRMGRDTSIYSLNYPGQNYNGEELEFEELKIETPEHPESGWSGIAKKLI